MFNPKYQILLTRKYFPQDKVVCLGTQLISIVSLIQAFLPGHMWYGADVDAVGKGAKKCNINNIQLNVIGTDFQFIEYCSDIEQFIGGVFLGINTNFVSQDIQGIELETEDEPFRSIPCEGVLIEIRAFDTSYFAIYSEDLDLMEKTAKIYDIEIDEIKS